MGKGTVESAGDRLSVNIGSRPRPETPDSHECLSGNLLPPQLSEVGTAMGQHLAKCSLHNSSPKSPQEKKDPSFLVFPSRNR